MLFKTIEKLHDQYITEQAPRWYPNDGGPVLNGTISEDGAKVEGYVGLVDEEVGGMVAFGPLDVIEQIADMLNRYNAIESIVAEPNPELLTKVK